MSTGQGITPAATNTGSTSRTSSSASTSAHTSTPTSAHTSSTSSSSSLSWDSSLVGWSVYSWGSPNPTAVVANTHHSTSLLSSKPAVAGICAGIAVVCLLISGFIFYRVHERRAKHRALLTDSGVSTPPSSKRAPTPFQLGARSRTTQSQARQTLVHSRSITPRSFQQALSRNTSTSTTQFLAATNARLINTPASGDVIRSSSSTSPQPSSLRNSLAPGTSEYTGRSTVPVRSLETSSPRSSAQISLPSSNRTSAKDPFTYPPQDITGLRPLPTIPIQIPAHPPPSYDAQSHHFPPVSSLSRDNSLAASSSADLSTATINNLSNFSEPHLIKAEKVGRSSHGSHPGYIPPSETLHDEAVYLDEKASFERVPHKPSTDHIKNDLHILGEAIEMNDITSSDVPQDVMPEQEQDPFENARYEIPGWLNSDPFPNNQKLKHSASQPSLISRPRSTAASSCVLPSDSSIRTLTPEPPPSPPPPKPMTPTGAASIRSHTTQTTQAINLTGETVVYHRTIEGPGPAVEDLVIMHGAERPGWARAISSLSEFSNASTSSPIPTAQAPIRSRNRFPPDSFDPNEGNPLSRSSTIQVQTPPPPPRRPAALPLQSSVQSLESYRSTFLSMSPLSASLPGRGLSRAYTTFDHHRPRPLNTNVASHSRSNSYSMSPSLTRSLTSVHISSRGLSGLEDIGFRSPGLYSGISNSQPNLFGGGQTSMLPSSNVFPAEQESIRSISPEIGWIGGEGEDGNHDQESKLAKPSGNDENPSTVRPANAHADTTLELNRQSRFSVGEGGILWGRLTSALEAQDEI